MQKTLRSKDHERLLGLLVAARRNAGLNQETLAEALGRPQSFVAKYEGGERRIDVIEFVTIARALGADPVKLLASFVAGAKASLLPRKPARSIRPSRTSRSGTS
jgi:transcriptional regulator with XRE-family HTH domain